MPQKILTLNPDFISQLWRKFNFPTAEKLGKDGLGSRLRKSFLICKLFIKHNESIHTVVYTHTINFRFLKRRFVTGLRDESRWQLPRPIYRGYTARPRGGVGMRRRGVD